MALTLDTIEVNNPISLTFNQGEDVNITIAVADTSDVPSNLNGTVVTSDIRKEYHTAVLASFTVDSSDLVNGNITLSLSAADTTTLPTRRNSRVTSFVFDVKFTYADTSVDIPIHGYLKMTRTVTA